MSIETISTESAPKAVGPYSQAACHGPWIFCSGQVPLDPQSGSLIEGNIQEQTHQVMKNLQNVLEAAGAKLSDVIKTTIYLQDMENFSKVNDVYAGYFTPPYPARATVEVARLPLNADVEIEVIACRS
ncbi:RidA family protein [Pseudobacteriovorax antillogorgiicola]|uniref:Endoribonuclease L-PSP n=1 Tax=Pseudobacteriovorax antillogorgiicola TaxID=1513793 RepID=A0A1Y6CUN5_9BACT|nr:RidA family protein [Pseudobacteriovorax antillogorgiicola]TCS44404.1 endoribonuclease L-PSP [Pseudobacteriovorax antillogorgiicola]SMF79235.1 endoribonuclease L-PSP [Pseudobacteriovorax antillogorgiicola]